MLNVKSGVELGGALKNVLAIGCGISDGLGFGCNGRAALITRGLSEMTRLAVALGAHPLTMGGLAGMGDLVLTCTGIASSTRFKTHNNPSLMITFYLCICPRQPHICGKLYGSGLQHIPVDFS